jgi:hypothetical protein
MKGLPYTAVNAVLSIEVPMPLLSGPQMPGAPATILKKDTPDHGNATGLSESRGHDMPGERHASARRRSAHTIASSVRGFFLGGVPSQAPQPDFGPLVQRREATL